MKFELKFDINRKIFTNKPYVIVKIDEKRMSIVAKFPEDTGVSRSIDIGIITYNNESAIGICDGSSRTLSKNGKKLVTITPIQLDLKSLEGFVPEKILNFPEYKYKIIGEAIEDGYAFPFSKANMI